MSKAQEITDLLLYNNFICQDDYTSVYLVIEDVLGRKSAIRDPKPGENPPGKKVVAKDNNIIGMQG